MVDNEKERKEVMEVIRFVLLSTEELKTAVSPLVRDQKDVFKILKSHEEAITSLMEKLIGTKEYHEKRLKTLELLKTSVSELEEKQEIHESVHKALEKRLKRLEFEWIGSILKKIGERELISVNDLKVVEDVLSLYPDDDNLLSVKSEVLDALGRKQEALEFLEEAISKHPNSARLWYEKGLLHKDFDEQLKSFDKSLELLKDSAPIYQHAVLHSRAAVLGSAERFEEALSSSTKSLELNPNCYLGWVLKGMILIELARIPESLGCFEKAIELEKNRKEAWFEKGNALFVLGLDHVDEAIACYDKAIELNPKWAIAYFNKGKALIRKDQYEKAIQSLDKGLEIDEKEPCGWCDRGVALNRLKRREEAFASFKKALGLSPPKKCFQIFINMAIALRNLKRYEEAVEILDKTVIEYKNLEKWSPDWINKYAILLYRNKRYEEGAEIAKSAVEAEPENVTFWDVFACNLQALGRDEEALKAFEKAMSLRKSDKEISWDDLAKLYERMGRKKEAEQAYQKYESIKKKEAEHANNLEQ